MHQSACSFVHRKDKDRLFRALLKATLEIGLLISQRETPAPAMVLPVQSDAVCFVGVLKQVFCNAASSEGRLIAQQLKDSIENY